MITGEWVRKQNKNCKKNLPFNPQKIFIQKGNIKDYNTDNMPNCLLSN